MTNPSNIYTIVVELEQPLTFPIDIKINGKDVNTYGVRQSKNKISKTLYTTGDKVIDQEKSKKPLALEKGQVFTHYKGITYEIVGFAMHSETNEELVLYAYPSGKSRVWARPVSMFLEVMEDGLPRFRLKT